MGAALLRGLLLLVALSVAPDAFADDFAPEPGSPPAAFRGDFAAAWAITDGRGLANHAALTGTWGVQIGDAVRGRSIGIAPVITATLGAAEGGEFSMRVGGGAEVVLPLHPEIELVPSLLGGYLRSVDGDERQGPFFKAGIGVRLVPGIDHFWIQIEPLSLVVLPPPPGGFTRYTAHVAVDVALVRFGGRTR